jgi:hypothetical protein
MQKIMFNDKFGLTKAVLDGRKTMTRRIIPEREAKRLDSFYGGDDWYYAVQTCIDDSSRFDIGEEVAVAQSYRDVVDADVRGHYIPRWSFIDDHCDEAGWNNKMFVKAELMPHRIRITNIKVERLQDISEEDCLKEGITTMTEGKFEAGNAFGWDTKIDALERESFFTPRAAFAALIDKVSGKGTWDQNDWQFAYTFKLVK